ncbi:E3 ubiquitin-protein ligase SINA-like 5 [Raphanus sativus]|uniref:RING-type E3 ubiquitin transferase n=1 Tax=Raphanus sativus TaxID=3726 RepID=A0A9W3D816_RAPSA|nr:E3 ubiquitin-protein ligase SINA-like 5 [Raphanus sativus]
MAIPQRLHDEEEEDEIAEAAAGGVTRTRSETSSSTSSSSSSSSSEQQQQYVTLKSSDVLDCPTCCEPLTTPIYQCANGHVACSSCCEALRKRCAFCRSHIGSIRCRAMEMVIESSTVQCRYSLHGCGETTPYGRNQSSHEELCAFVPYSGSYADLKRHGRASHSEVVIPFALDRAQILGLDRMAVLQEVEEGGDLVVVQAFEGVYGVSVTVSCVAAPMATTEVRDLFCSVAELDGCCSTVRRLGLMVRRVQRVGEQEQPPGGFMLIPYDDKSCGGDHLMLQICISTESNFEL